jgi:uncharacterized membrane-anchored protein
MILAPLLETSEVTILLITFLASGLISGFTPFILMFRYGNKVVALVMGKLSFKLHTFTCALLNALTGSYIWLGSRILFKFLRILLGNHLVAGCIVLVLMSFLLGIYIHNADYYAKRFEEVYGEKAKTRKAFLKRISVTTLPFLVAFFVSDYITSIHSGI